MLTATPDTCTKPLQISITERIDERLVDNLRSNIEPILKTSEPILYERKAAGDQIPQFIQLLGGVAAWLPLAAAATTYLSRFASRLGDKHFEWLETKFRKKDEGEITEFVDAVQKIIRSSEPKTKFNIGIDLPDDRWGTVLTIDSSNPTKAARQITLFATNVEKIYDVLSQACVKGDGPIAQGKIEMLEDGSVKLTWMAQSDFKKRVVVLDERLLKADQVVTLEG